MLLFLKSGETAEGDIKTMKKIMKRTTSPKEARFHFFNHANHLTKSISLHQSLLLADSNAGSACYSERHG